MQLHHTKLKPKISDIKVFLLSTICLLFFGCQTPIRNGDQLTKDELAYIQNLGLLEEGETIIQFDSQGNFEQSGNFFSDKRIASYWIDDNPDKHSVQFALFEEIDSLIGHNVSKSSLLSASYLEVFLKSGTQFKVHVDSDSAEVSSFFEEAQKQLDRIKN